MEFEQQPNRESFATKEEILDVIDKHREGLEFTIEIELSDENGIYFIVMTTKPDSEGYIREYTYMRKHPKTGAKTSPKVYVGYFEDDMPVGGGDLHTF